MKDIVDEIKKAFLESNINSIKENTLEFVKQVTKSILENREDELKSMIDVSCDIRDSIEMDLDMERNKEFYFGYLYAYENVLNNIFDHRKINDDIYKIIVANDKVKRLIEFLGKEKAARQKDIAEHLNMESNELANFMKTDYLNQANILSKNKVGRNVIYSLNARGRKYYQSHGNGIGKSYSESDILGFLEYIDRNRGKNIESLIKENPSLEKTIIRKMHSLTLSEEIIASSERKIKVYINNAKDSKYKATKKGKYNKAFNTGGRNKENLPA